MTHNENQKESEKPDIPAASLRGEVSGAFMEGLIMAFKSLCILPEEAIDPDIKGINAGKWYPLSKLVDFLKTIERSVSPSPSLYFMAGVKFIRIWYEQGPGKTLVSSTQEWMRLHQGGQGYNSVVRGGNPEEIGYSLLRYIDDSKGETVIEDLNPLPAEYVRGVHYGGYLLFDDMDFFDVRCEEKPYDKHPDFTRKTLTIHFRPKLAGVSGSLETLLAHKPNKPGIRLTPEQSDVLISRYQSLKVRYGIELGYQRELNRLFREAVERSHRLSEQLLIAKTKADAANQAKTEFLAKMSHDLRTPLHHILGYTQLLQHDNGLPAHYHDVLNTMYRSGKHLNGLINDVLDLSKIEAGEMENVSAPFDLHDFLASLTDMFQPQAQLKGLEFICEFSPTLPRCVEADEKRLLQIFVNLLGNAMKFTEQGEVRLCVKYAGNKLYAEIADTGIGMEPEVLGTIFSPFVQVGSRDYQAQGTGLALAICKNLVGMMNGTIRVASEPGSGTQFFVELPVLAVQASASPHVASFTAPDSYRRLDGLATALRVLIIDDCPVNLKMLRMILHRVGFDVEQAGSAAAGIETARKNPPDLILIDMVMPDLDGLEATRRLREVKELQQIPVIACSANTFEEDIQASLAAGCIDHLAKPIEDNLLFAILERHLPIEWLEDQG